MLVVFTKEKIISYFIAFSTVATLICVSMVNINRKETIETSSNLTTDIETKNVIYGE